MANFSTYYQSGILNRFFRSNSNSFDKPTCLFLALCSGVPANTCNANNIPELPGGIGYSRWNFGAPANSIFADVLEVSNSGDISNLGTLTFGPATANWGYVSGVAVLDSGGNMVLWGALATPRVVFNQDSFLYNASNLSIFLG